MAISHLILILEVHSLHNTGVSMNSRKRYTFILKSPTISSMIIIILRMHIGPHDSAEVSQRPTWCDIYALVLVMKMINDKQLTSFSLKGTLIIF